jgi:hypothetical protein
MNQFFHDTFINLAKRATEFFTSSGGSLGSIATNTQNTATNTQNTASILDLVEAHNRLQVETLGMPSVPRQLSVTTVSTGVQLTASCRRASLVAVGCAMRFRVGSSSVAAQTADHLIQQGERIDIHLPATPWINVIRDSAATANGTLNISELTA